MQERLDYVRIQPQRVFDLGCSRGGSFEGLIARYPDAETFGVDFAPEMLKNERGVTKPWLRWLQRGRGVTKYVAAEVTALPIRSATAGLVWSNLLLHWLGRPQTFFTEVHRILEVGGLLMFSTLGPDSLKELRWAFGDGPPRTLHFLDMHDVGDMLVAAGFADPVMDMEVITLTYDSFDDLLHECRASGSFCAMNTRSKGLAGRGYWSAARERYDSLRQNGKLPATLEVVYGHAWKPQPKSLEDGRAIIRFDPHRKAR